jgi:CRISPR/Cas system-associated protein Cas10 (large subunit of type III CRISPR-Cas system)
MDAHFKMVYRNTKLIKLLRELPCQHCGIESETVCAAHRNEGKGMGIKVSDSLCAALCIECHVKLDNGKELTKEERRDMWNRAYIKTMQYLFEHDMIGVK